MKTYKKTSDRTLQKRKKTIVVLTEFDDEAIQLMKYAVETFGVDAMYILLNIHSFDGTNNASPDDIREEILEKLIIELGAIRTFLDDLKPEITTQFEFGNIKELLRSSWEKGEFDLVVVQERRRGVFGWMGSLPCKNVPVLVVPDKFVLQKSDSN